MTRVWGRFKKGRYAWGGRGGSLRGRGRMGTRYVTQTVVFKKGSIRKRGVGACRGVRKRAISL